MVLWLAKENEFHSYITMKSQFQFRVLPLNSCSNKVLIIMPSLVDTYFTGFVFKTIDSRRRWKQRTADANGDRKKQKSEASKLDHPHSGGTLTPEEVEK